MGVRRRGERGGYRVIGVLAVVLWAAVVLASGCLDVSPTPPNGCAPGNCAASGGGDSGGGGGAGGTGGTGGASASGGAGGN